MSGPKVSLDARCVAAGFFALNDDCEVSFQRPHIIHPRTLAAFGELVSAGYATVDHRPNGGIAWKGQPGVHDLGRTVSRAELKRNTWPITTE